MEQEQATSGEDKALVSVRTMEVVFALIIVGFGLLVMFDSIRLGAGWEEGLGPQAGYFPFYISLFIIGSGAVCAIAALMPGAKAAGDEAFTTRTKISSVLRVYIPTVLYVVLINFVGLYAAAALYITGFMVVNGGYSIIRALPYAIIFPVILFVLFERWFLISLPKGPIEAMLGF